MGAALTGKCCVRARKASRWLLSSVACAGTQRTSRRARRGFAGAALTGSCSNGARWHASQWLENSAEQDVDAPVERCYAMWEDRELIPQWMPWIKTVKVTPASFACGLSVGLVIKQG